MILCPLRNAHPPSQLHTNVCHCHHLQVPLYRKPIVQLGRRKRAYYPCSQTARGRQTSTITLYMLSRRENERGNINLTLRTWIMNWGNEEKNGSVDRVWLVELFSVTLCRRAQDKRTSATVLLMLILRCIKGEPSDISRTRWRYRDRTFCHFYLLTSQLYSRSFSSELSTRHSQSPGQSSP